MAHSEGIAAQGGVAAEPEEATGLALEELLPEKDAPGAAPRESRAPKAAYPIVNGLRTARVTQVSGRKVTIRLRGQSEPVDAVVAPEVDPEVVADAHANEDSVLVELSDGEAPLIVAVLQTRRPREIRLKAETLHLEGEKEILLRSGRGAIRIREDGEIEVVGSRISAASRGLFRIVGRILRLN